MIKALMIKQATPAATRFSCNNNKRILNRYQEGKIMRRKITAIITAIFMTIIAAMLPGGAMQTAKAAGTQNWAEVGTARFSQGYIDYTSLAFDAAGTPYVAYADWNNGRRATVMKYNGSSWETVGTAGFSAGMTADISLALDAAGTPYVAYFDGGNASKATVMKYNGSSWENVGTPGFSRNWAEFTSLAFDAADTPYVAYKDWGFGHKTVVKKYNGSSWETVGTAGFSADYATHTSLALDAAGTPYVAYVDFGNGEKATVMKYNGSDWENVGTAGFSAGSAKYTSLALDAAGTPYVAYVDGGNGEKATVMKYNGSSWENVGTAGFTEGDASYTILALDDAGTPYVAYKGYGSKVTVMKYNGSDWETVGTAGFSVGNIWFSSLAFDDAGVPFVALGHDKNATVMRLNNAPTDLDLSNHSVSEEQAIGTVVGTLSSSDPDRYESCTYSLVSGKGDDDNDSFSIVGDQLKTTKVFDYETKSVYRIRVHVTDAGGLYYDYQFAISIQNVQGDSNDNAIVVDMGPIIPKGAVGSAYSFTPTVTKGTSPYTWTATGLPTGLSIDSATGEISGVPTATGTSAVSATVTDSRGAVLTVGFDITIGYASLSIDTPSILAATIGESYTCSLSASGGDGSNSWYASGLPKGLSISRESGIISGTPGETGTFSVEVKVYDGEGRKATKTYSLVVSPPSAKGKYKIVPDTDSAYTVSTADGFTTLTIKSGVTGFRYLKVSLQPVVTHEGKETVVFVQQRAGVQIGYSFVEADFDADSNAGVGFNVMPGDIIRVYVVDALSNSSGTNPVLFQ